MERWRRKGDQCNQEIVRTKPNCPYRKPPVGGNSTWHPNIPYWEKRFVYLVGSLSWKKFLEAKEFTYLYDNVMNWDDRAGEEAFHIAKDGFYAKFHGLPCDEKLHNPDLYIDKIDWNAEMDHGLIQDLDSDPVGDDDGRQHEPVVIFEGMLPDPYKDYSPFGWGDSDDKVKNSWGMSEDVKKEPSAVNWDNCDVGGGNNDWWAWDENGNKGDQGWNTSSYDDNNCYGYSNVNNNRRPMASHKSWFDGNYNQRRNNGNWRNSTGQRYESQHDHGSTFHGRGSQRVRVHQ